MQHERRFHIVPNLAAIRTACKASYIAVPLPPFWRLGRQTPCSTNRDPPRAATRMLSGADISGHVIGFDAVNYVKRRKGIPLDLELAKRRLSRCVVGLLDDMPATNEALAHWFPWLPKAGHALNVNDRRPRRESLRPGEGCSATTGLSW